MASAAHYDGGRRLCPLDIDGPGRHSQKPPRCPMLPGPKSSRGLRGRLPLLSGARTLHPRLPSYKTLQKSQNFPQVRGLSTKISRLPKTLTSVRSDFRSKFLESPQSFQKPEAWLQKSVVLLTKMDLTEFRSSTRIGTGSGGLAAWDGFRWVNVLDGLPQSGQSSMPHGTRSRRLCGMTISVPSHGKASTLNRKPPFPVPALAPLSTPRRGGASLARIGFRV